ncbi:MAG: PilC/PilY family type IV pilus protein, partial [Stenotrophomonas sp.]
MGYDVENRLLVINETEAAVVRRIFEEMLTIGSPTKIAANLTAEGITTKANATSFSGRGNSAYIAGLAYYANTNDIRTDVAGQPNTLGKQTLSTYWVDVRENQILEPKATNQYWLTAKYGGFDVPAKDFDPLTTTGLTASWWHNSKEYLTSGSGGGVTTTVNNYPRPDNFYVASEADKMVASLRQAFESIARKAEGSASSFASNSTKLEAGARTFQAQFVTGQNREWAGRLYAYDVNTDTGALTQAWSATDQFPVWGPTNATTNARQIFYNNAGTLAGFQGAVGGLSAAVVNYLRGDRSGEKSNGGAYRNRLSLLGDIVNSQPVYVGAPNARLYTKSSFAGASGYAAFASAQATRTPIVYVGANDGMLHAFNANTGKEVFAFVPTEGMSNLTGTQKFTDPAYEHTYTVDGAMTAADWYDGAIWRTALVGTMGRGGKTIFALDVTAPGTPKLMWEISDASLGNNLGQPIISQVSDGQWRVLLGNGPNSADGIAKLVVINMASGAVSTVSTAIGNDNGLAGINAWSAAGNGLVDTVYAGDMKGNLWRFKLGTGTASRLYAAGETKPFTAAPLVAVNPKTLQTWV